MAAAPRTRVRRVVWVVAIAVVLLVAGGLGTYYLVFVASSHPCVAGGVLATENHTLTPYDLVNSPYLGSATGVYVNSTGSGGQIVYASNASAWAYFEDLRWTILEGVHQGTGSVCPGAFFAAWSDNFSGVTSSLGWELRNDSAELTSSGDNGTSYSVVDFSNSFSKSTSSVSTCGSGPMTLGLISHSIEVQLPFSVNGIQHMANATVAALVLYSYRFPGATGTWEVDNLSAPGGPGGGWAFSYVGGCP